MKKILTLVMVSVLVLSLGSMAFAAEFSSSMGGRFYGYFTTIDGDKGFNPAPGNDVWDTILAATVKGDYGSWARLSFVASSWEQTVNAAFGWDNIAGSNWSLHFDTHDTGTCNLGQQAMGDLFNDFKADPIFNTCDMAGSFGVKYITDTFEFRTEAKVYDGNGSTRNDLDGTKYTDADGNEQVYGDAYTEKYAMALIFKRPNGKYYVGMKHAEDKDDDFFIVGCDTKFTDNLGLKLDVYSDKSNYNGLGDIGNLLGTSDGIKPEKGGKSGSQSVQATITYDKITAQAQYIKPEADFDDAIGLGLAYQFTDRLNAGVKYFMIDEDIDVDVDNIYDIYALYNLGVVDFKLGVSNTAYTFGQGGANNAGQSNNGSCKAYQPEDPFFYAGFHFEF